MVKKTLEPGFEEIMICQQRKGPGAPQAEGGAVWRKGPRRPGGSTGKASDGRQHPSAACFSFSDVKQKWMVWKEARAERKSEVREKARPTSQKLLY